MSAALEQINHRTLLGIRFRDAVVERLVRDGLRVTAQRLSDDGSRRIGRLIVGRATVSGVITFFGLHPAELVVSDPQAQFPNILPQPEQVVIDMSDTYGRYLPMAFPVSIPHRGAFAGQADWVPNNSLQSLLPNGEQIGVFLWSAATGSTPTGMAMLRAQIVVGAVDEPPPAAHAFVVISDRGNRPYACGLTDAAGRLALPLPYPTINNTAQRSLGEQRFPLRARIYYRPDDQVSLPGSAVPSLPSLFAQAQARIIIRRGTVRQMLDFELSYGVPFVLRTMIGGSPEARESILRIQPV